LGKKKRGTTERTYHGLTSYEKAKPGLKELGSYAVKWHETKGYLFSKKGVSAGIPAKFKLSPLEEWSGQAKSKRKN